MIVISPDPILRKVAAQVDKVDSWIKKTLGKMEKIVEANYAVGLAAPQIAISQAFFVMKRSTGTFIQVINPNWTPVDNNKTTEDESCLSLPGLVVPVARFDRIFLDYIDSDGEPRFIRLSGLEARICQHECDHLHGILITDYI